MSDAFIIAIGLMSAVSLVLLLKNTVRERIPGPRVEVVEPLKISIEGRTMKGVLYVSESLPPGDRDPGRRVLRLARDAGVSVSIVSSLYKVPRDKMLHRLEEAIGKLEAAYSISRSARIKSLLETITSIYEEVALASQPYWGSLAAIVWVPEGPEGLARAEAFKTLLEAELGVALKRVEAENCLEALAPRPGPRPVRGETLVIPRRQYNVEGSPVVIGWRLDLESAPFSLDYPDDFSTHVGIVGPTGRGKTVLLAGITVQLLAYMRANGDPRRILVLDPKGDLARLLMVRDEEGFTILGPETGVNEGVRVLNELWCQARETGGNGRVIVVLDEAWRYMRAAPGLFEAISREGRSLGFHMIYAVQEPSDIPRAVADNTGFFIVFGGKTREYAEAAARLGLGDAALELVELPVGEAIAASRDASPVPVRIMDFTKLLKTLRRPRGPKRGSGEQRVGEEPETAAHGQGITHIQEPRAHTPRTSEVPAPTEREG